MTERLRDLAREWCANNLGDEDKLLLEGRAYNLAGLLERVEGEALERAAAAVAGTYPHLAATPWTPGELVASECAEAIRSLKGGSNE